MTTKLAIDCNYININLPTELDCPIIYRYSQDEVVHKNFLEGNIWFAGINQNRFFHEPPDYYEYKSINGTAILASSLSFTTNPKDVENWQDLFWIKIANIAEFMKALKNDIENTKSTFCHEVSWLSKKEVIMRAGLINFFDMDNSKDDWIVAAKKKATEMHPGPKLEAIIESEAQKLIPTIFYSPDNLSMIENDQIAMRCVGLRGYKICYRSKTEYKDEISDIVSSIYSKEEQFKREVEWRIELNTSSFLNENGHLLNPLVKHIQLRCPSVKRHCTTVDLSLD